VFGTQVQVARPDATSARDLNYCLLIEIGGLTETDGQDPDDGGGLFGTLENELKHRQQSSGPASSSRSLTRARTATCRRTRSNHAAKESQSHNEGRIAELEDKLARAEVIDVSKLSGDTIKFGATVTLVDEDTEKKQVWQLVGEPEADAKKGKISITSPLARALIGKAKGANVEVVTPSGAKALRDQEGRVAVDRRRRSDARCDGRGVSRPSFLLSRHRRACPGDPVDWLHNLLIKIPPRGTLLRDKLGLPGARPVLDVLFPLDGVVSCVVHLEIGELVNSVSLGTNRFCARTLGARDRW